MITIKINIPHAITQVMSPKMVMGNYIECDPRVKFLQGDKSKGYCTVNIITEHNWDEGMCNMRIEAIYHSPEQELLTLLSM